MDFKEFKFWISLIPPRALGDWTIKDFITFKNSYLRETGALAKG